MTLLPGKRAFSIGAGLVLLAGATTSPLGAYSLYLKARVFVKSAEVRLGQLARVEGEARPGSVAGKLVFRNLTEPQFISRDVLQSKLGKGPEKLTWIYGSGVWVVPLTQKVTGGELLERLKSAIGKRPGGSDFLKKAIFQVPPGSSYDLPPGDGVHFQIPARLEHLRPGRRLMIVALRGKDGKGRLQTIHRLHFGFTLLRREKLPVAKRDLAPGRRIAPEDWELREIASAELRGRPLTGTINGRRLTAPVAAGTVLTDQVARDLPAVRAGQKVQLVYQAGAVIVKCESIAEGTGEVGRQVRVRPMLPSGRRGRSVVATVVGDGLVQVGRSTGGSR